MKIPVANYGVTLSEIPGEISLYFNIGNCTTHCKGCHSPELWDTAEEDLNTYMTPEDILDIIDVYRDGITAILFMGGQRNKIKFAEFILNVIRPASDIKPVGIYMGDCNISDLFAVGKWCRWVKIGTYMESFGGLDDPDTNQLFMEVQNHKFHNK